MTDRIYYSSEAEQIAKTRQTVGLLAFLMLGLGVGAATALLFAPQEGERTRKMVADALDEGFRRGREATDDALAQLEEEFPNLRKKVESTLSKATS